MNIDILTKNQIRNLIVEELEKKADYLERELEKIRKRMIKLEEEVKTLR